MKREQFDVPDRIIARLTKEYGGNVHDHHVVDVTSASLEKETYGANPHSGHTIAVLIVLRRKQLIWKLIHVSVRLIANRKKIFRI
jgi:hypothetical protein